ncbi:MAG TPA: DinB family protein [Bryobacteraceae bacterium]|nr:DinB family protein [Bryobacteraceae bacterium]
MKRSSLLFVAAALVGVCSLHAQNIDPVIKDARASYNTIKGYLTRAAEAMPEANYTFQPTPEIRTFAALLAHIADHQVRFCSASRGTPRKTDYLSKTTKADLVEALAASYKECDAAWDGLTSANAAEMMGQRSRMGWLLGDVIHSNEEYGYMSIYFRLKGLVPPSSDRAGRK